jgi:hypothetical protein
MGRNYLRIVLCVVTPLLVAGTVFFKDSPENLKIFMNGELSNKHSYLENDCKSCHMPWNGMNNESCTSCHGDDEHYVPDESTEAHEQPAKILRCFDCHQEHRGRLHNITEVADEST